MFCVSSGLYGRDYLKINVTFSAPHLIFSIYFFAVQPANSLPFRIFLFSRGLPQRDDFGGTKYLLEISPEKNRSIYLGFINSLVGPTIFLSGAGGLIIQLTSFTLLYFIVLTSAILAIFQSLCLIPVSKKVNGA